MLKIAYPGFVFCVACAILIAPLRGLAADPTPQEILKSKGLSPVGQKFLLDADVGLTEWLRQVRALERKVDDANKRRTNLERDIRSIEKSCDDLFQQWKAEKEKLSRISKNADVTYNKQVRKVNGLRAEILDGLDQIKKRHATIQTIGDPSDEYVALMIKFGAAIDATVEKYKALSEDAQVKTAIGKINQVGTLKVTLGPSDRLNTELPEIRKLRDKVNSDTINFEMHGGVPTVPVTLNGNVQISAIVDSGAASVSISEKLAKRLDLKPGPNDRKTHVVTADGTISEVSVMTIKSIRLGRFTVENVECVVVPDNGKNVDTLLGGTFLRRFVYRMDLAAGQLRLSQVLDNAATNVPASNKQSTTTPPPASPKTATGPVGAWIKVGTGTRLTFLADGTLVGKAVGHTDAKTGKWTTDGNSVTVHYSGMNVVLVLTADRMTDSDRTKSTTLTWDLERAKD
jgi:clan AA aspartic protease (TIGR02281 family)